MKTVPTDRFFWTADNVRLHYHDYAGGADGRPVLLCLPGLTRNARDFQEFAEYFSPDFRVLAASFRGRGESGYAFDPLTYVPLTYLRDMTLLLDDADAERFVVIGTSLGGIIGLLLGSTQPERIVGLALNDASPEPEADGMARVRQLIGRGDNWRSWLIAAREIARLQTGIYPDWTLEDWLPQAKRLCRLSREGRIIWDYDPEIVTPFGLASNELNDDELDLWLALDSFRDKPVLSMRGELSDMLSAEGQARMHKRLPGMATVTIPRVGHVPTLAEAESIAALEEFLAQFR